VNEVLEGVRVGSLMRRAGQLMPATATVRSAIDGWFVRTRDNAYPIVNDAGDGRFLGLVTVTDIHKVSPDTWDYTPVTAVMTPRERLSVVAPTDDARDALRALAELDVEQLPVVARSDEGEAFLGIVSRSDIARWLEIHTSGPTTGSLHTA
jgi:CBS domain-containing protein